jgi:hypothetical protein
MYQLTLNLAFVFCLILSITLKVLGGGIGQGVTTASSGNEDIAALLDRNGFAVSLSDPNTDPQWFYGTKMTCRVQIADVSPQGWHRSALEWHAKGRTLLYSVEGKLYEHQPIMMPMIDHYVRRALRYLGVHAGPVRARAIIVDSQCPAHPITAADLEGLS